MGSSRVSGGVVHKLPTDLRKALLANDTALATLTVQHAPANLRRS
jgi:hypothetical protein